MTKFISRFIGIMKKPVCFIIAFTLSLMLAQIMAQYSIIISSKMLNAVAHPAAPVGGVDLFNYTYAVSLMQALVTASVILSWPIYRWIVAMVDRATVFVKSYYGLRAKSRQGDDDAE